MNINFLATTTGSRQDEFEALIVSFNSLVVPSGISVHMYVFDQAPKNHDEIFRRQKTTSDRSITRIESQTLLGLSAARNCLLRRLEGDCYVIFCDDDALYSPSFIIDLQQEFAHAGEVDIALFKLLNKGETTPYGRRQYPSQSRNLLKYEVITLAISLNLIVKLKCINDVGGFNEDLGVGSKGFCGEETELMLKAIDSGARSYFFETPIAFHPRQEVTSMSNKKIHQYSLGYREMLLSYRGSLYLIVTIRVVLIVTIFKCFIGLLVLGQQRKSRLIKLKGLLGVEFSDWSYD